MNTQKICYLYSYINYIFYGQANYSKGVKTEKYIDILLVSPLKEKNRIYRFSYLFELLLPF